MKLLLRRDFLTDGFTLGKLYINDRFKCYTVEDAVRDVKIPKITAIPYGEYEVRLTMSARFKKVLPLLLDVPNFTGVRIHAGNTADDTEGCIIVGMERSDNGVLGSRDAMRNLMSILEKADDPIWLTVSD